MDDILTLQKKIVPEIVELLERRYNILRTIYYYQPIGRRILANTLNLGERCIRNEIKFLKESKFITVNSSGMYITSEGKDITEGLKKFLHELNGLNKMENELKEYLKVKKVIVVPGNVDNDKTLLKELGKAASAYLKTLLKNDLVIAVTGGTSVKELAESMENIDEYEDMLILPARGGMGSGIDVQSNTIAENLADKLNADCKLLHVPDNLSENTIKAMLKEENIAEVVGKISKCDVLIYGIGIAEEMAMKRGLSRALINEILEKGAVGEGFGHYFNQKGEIVYYTSTIGIKNQDALGIENLIAIAGGKSKAKAIISTQINRNQSVLVTDQGAAEEILRIFNNDNDNNNY